MGDSSRSREVSPQPGLSLAVDDPPSGQIVWREGDLDLVAGDDPYVVLSHLAGKVGENVVSIFSDGVYGRFQSSTR